MDYLKGLMSDQTLDKQVQSKLMLESTQGLQFLIPLLPSSHLMANKAKAISTANPGEQQLQQQEMGMKLQAHQQDMQMQAQSHQMDMAAKQHELQIKQHEFQLKQAETAYNIQQQQIKTEQEVIHKEENHKQDVVHKEEQHQVDVKATEQAAQSKAVSNKSNGNANPNMSPRVPI